MSALDAWPFDMAAVSATFSVERRRHADLKAIVDKLKAEKVRVLVGIPIGIDSDVDPSTSVAVIAARNEFGSRSDFIPERPFLRIGVQNSSAKYSALSAKQLPNVLAGTITIDDLLNMLGDMAASSVQKQIRHGSYMRNSPSTIAMKGSDKPLIDSGQMLQSITWVIERNGAY